VEGALTSIGGFSDLLLALAKEEKLESVRNVNFTARWSNALSKGGRRNFEGRGDSWTTVVGVIGVLQGDLYRMNDFVEVGVGIATNSWTSLHGCGVWLVGGRLL
jgi:hypothetical protein